MSEELSCTSLLRREGEGELINLIPSISRQSFRPCLRDSSGKFRINRNLHFENNYPIVKWTNRRARALDISSKNVKITSHVRSGRIKIGELINLIPSISRRSFRRCWTHWSRKLEIIVNFIG